MAKRTAFNLNNNIRQLREAAGITRAQLAKDVDIGLSTLARYESSSFDGIIANRIQQQIAKALGKDTSTVFPQRETGVSRRQFIGSTVGAGLAIGGMGPYLAEGVFSRTHNRQQLSSVEIKVLADDNYALWELLNTLQRGGSIDYVTAVAQGKLVTLKHLAQCSLLPNQKTTVLKLLADVYILLGRIARETQNYGAGDFYAQEAEDIAHEINDPNVKAVQRLRYGHMLIDQGRFAAAVKNGEAVLVEAKGAAFPIWAESQLVAAHAFAYVGRFAEAQRIAHQSRDAKQGSDPEIWIGKVTNPRTVYTHFDVEASLVAGHHLEAAKAAEDSLINLDREEPDNTQWRAHLQNLRATALWRLGSLDEAVYWTAESMKNARLSGSLINESRVEKLYQQMRTSPNGQRQSVHELGEMIMTS